MHGILNFDKPVGISSALAVAKVKRLLERGMKIGHAGTLDPFASGVLLLLVGKATKRCEELMDAPKQYEAAVKLGATTATDDPESPEVPWAAATTLSRDRVEVALRGFVGAILQRPPAYSAMKIGGRRAYKLARQGHPVELQPRPVQIYGIELLAFEWPEVRLRIDCGRGTYIRALARDLGAALDVGGYLTTLRRTRIGEFHVETAATLERLAADGVTAHLLP